jgi:hypothetical protein
MAVEQSLHVICGVRLHDRSSMVDYSNVVWLQVI